VSEYVLDASALLALIRNEPGGDRVLDLAQGGAAISAVNLSEVVAKLAEQGRPEQAIREALELLAVKLDVVEFDEQLAYRAGLLRPLTRQAGLSLGDRACLALAERLDVPALTTDRAWAGLRLDIKIQVIR
jgi:ribonuclease VapC